MVNETRMDDSSKVYGDYLYVAVMKDGTEKVVQSHLNNARPSELLTDLRAGSGWYKEPLPVDYLKTCDLFGRNLA